MCSPNHESEETVAKDAKIGWVTLPTTNIAPENGWLEDYLLIGEVYFQSYLLSNQVPGSLGLQNETLNHQPTTNIYSNDVSHFCAPKEHR